MHNERQRRHRLRALRLYTLVIRLYPKAHRQIFGVQMQQTFVDHYRDIEHSHGRVGITFWLGVLGDAARSIGREHLAAGHAAVERWGLGPYLPSGGILFGAVVAAAVGQRSALLVYTLAAVLVFVATSSAGSVPKAMTGAAALSVVLCGTLFASLTGQWRDLFDPILLLVAVLYGVKTAAGIYSRLVDRDEVLWRPEELRWGPLIAAFLLASCGISVLPPEDAWASAAVVLGVGSCTLCGCAGARVSRASTSIQAGFFASVTTLAIGLVLWIMSLPLLLVLVAWMTRGAIPGNHALDTSALHLWQTSALWGRELHVIPEFFPILLFTGIVGGFVGAILGFSPVDDERQRAVSLADRDVKP